jgi:hypothetical protein
MTFQVYFQDISVIQNNVDSLCDTESIKDNKIHEGDPDEA